MCTVINLQDHKDDLDVFDSPKQTRPSVFVVHVAVVVIEYPQWWGAVMMRFSFLVKESLWKKKLSSISFRLKSDLVKGEEKNGSSKAV